MGFVYMYVRHVRVWSLQRSEEVSDALELELEVTVRNHLGARYRIWMLCRSNKCP